MIGLRIKLFPVKYIRIIVKIHNGYTHTHTQIFVPGHNSCVVFLNYEGCPLKGSLTF